MGAPTLRLLDFAAALAAPDLAVALRPPDLAAAFAAPDFTAALRVAGLATAFRAPDLAAAFRVAGFAAAFRFGFEAALRALDFAAAFATPDFAAAFAAPGFAFALPAKSFWIRSKSLRVAAPILLTSRLASLSSLDTSRLRSATPAPRLPLSLPRSSYATSSDFATLWIALSLRSQRALVSLAPDDLDAVEPLGFVDGDIDPPLLVLSKKDDLTAAPCGQPTPSSRPHT
ncbi:MAG TPA: hypothetical protein VMG80_01225 [Solirubrobacteraceae bacterium]|nr:hypothetical protein [Solirubrobacteraceae bacterium]